MSTQHRMLAAGDRIESGNEFLSAYSGEWITTDRRDEVKAWDGKYRRPLTPATAQQQPSDAAQLAAEATRLAGELKAIQEQLAQTLARLTAALQQETK